jgi:hypothetical protein
MNAILRNVLWILYSLHHDDPDEAKEKQRHAASSVSKKLSSKWFEAFTRRAKQR